MEKEHPMAEMVINTIPVDRSLFGFILMLSTARMGALIIPIMDEAVNSCPTTPTVVLKVRLISIRMKPVRIPDGLVASCEKNNEGMKNLGTFSSTIINQVYL